MDYQEFYNEFNLVYNNLSSNQAPGLIKPEISVYLTKAQEIVTDSIYAEFEKSEVARRKLAKLVVTEKLRPTTIPNDNIIFPQYTATFECVPEVRYIINEQVKMSDSASACVKNDLIKVQPVLHDEINDIIENPYRFNLHRALRLDASYHDNTHIEILSKDKEHIEYYQIRFVKNPEPIFLYSSDEYDDTINGVQPPTRADLQAIDNLGSLPKETHRQIVEIAAKLAYQDYKS